MPNKLSEPKLGDYVLATKYSDGDPGDHFAVGWLSEVYDHFGSTRYVVVDGEGTPFRANGFRRVQKISKARGLWILERAKMMEQLAWYKGSKRSVWGWAKMPMNGEPRRMSKRLNYDCDPRALDALSVLLLALREQPCAKSERELIKRAQQYSNGVLGFGEIRLALRAVAGFLRLRFEVAD